MARIPDIERRLLNWARWRITSTSGAIGYASVSLELERVDKSGWDAQARIPLSDCEADETQQAISSLPAPLPLTLEVFYVRSGGIKHKARELGCAVATVHSRVDLAHRSIARWLMVKAEAAEAERSRVQALQRGPIGLLDAGSFPT